MCTFRQILLALSAASAVLGADNFAANELCSNLSSIINVIKQFTDLTIGLDFNTANPILHGPATIKLTDDVVTNCKASEMDQNTILFVGIIKDNITITFQESTEVVEINDFTASAHIIVTREKVGGHTIIVRPHLIEVTDFSGIIINGTAMDLQIALELLKPDLTKALSASELSRTRLITHSNSHVSPILLKQLLEQISQFFFYRLTVKKIDDESY